MDELEELKDILQDMETPNSKLQEQIPVNHDADEYPGKLYLKSQR